MGCKEEKWTIKICLMQEADKIPEGTELLCINGEGKKAVSMYKTAEKFVFELFTDANEKPLIVKAEATGGIKELELIWLGYRTELWSDGALRDEEWPDGVCLTAEDAAICCEQEFVQASLIQSASVREPACKSITDVQYWAPELGNHNVGDCMPFADEDTYHVFYLKDRHQHKSKWEKGAHQFAHISSTDLIHWQEHPVAIEITHQWEGSICTGSVIRVGNLYYAFYAARMTDGSSARLSFATSEDCIHFTKSEQYFTLTAPYETTSARDPEVFLGADGKYHMLLTTDLENADIPERSSCLAHLVSEDLTNWEQKEPFLVPGYTDQPECADYFEWNGWYYLIFSNYGTAKYRYSRQPFGPWICPENEMIDGLLYRVPKTANFHDRRIAAGFLSTSADGSSYAGSLVLREVVQNQDGTLSTCFVKELLPKVDNTKEKLTLDSGDLGGYRQTALPAKHEYLKIQMKVDGRADNYGLIIHSLDGQAYEIRMKPTQRTVGVYTAHSSLYYNPTKRELSGVDGLKDGCTLEVVFKGNILDICINQNRTLVCRMEENWPENGVECGCYVKDGKVEFETIV